jgi:hypothetical protein
LQISPGRPPGTHHTLTVGRGSPRLRQFSDQHELRLSEISQNATAEVQHNGPEAGRIGANEFFWTEEFIRLARLRCRMNSY